MISHQHNCIFTHVPKTGGKAVQAAFGLPLRRREYNENLPHITEAYRHAPISRYRDLPEFHYFKFAFVRNPWDRLVSAFFYLNAGGCNEHDERFRIANLERYGGCFSAFVRDLPRLVSAQHFRPQAHWLCDDSGRLLPDFVGRFETIAADFAAVAARLSISPRLPVMNQSVHGPYRDLYDAPSRNIVAQVYRRDIELFGYEF